MPSVGKNEKRSHYVKRAVDEMVHSEGMDPTAAVNKAEHMFNAKWQAPKKKKKAPRRESMAAFVKRRNKETKRKKT